MHPRDVVRGLPEIDLDDDSLVESCVLIVKVSEATVSSMRILATETMSYWEMLGLLVDAREELRREADE